ncbi:uncharacterized protein TNIN_140541 [Trichonephila inaurata madagascariensis]|uniref:Uncharacterized protein n=1 Tax=Trichonephila inaurata madagascariensis TaxID=2747483 RepID=A0A8X6ICQ8_9ARAC|nr:uncharacterized protein TNIN_140541 [Trichonephila inaurata madagascariensis]
MSKCNKNNQVREDARQALVVDSDNCSSEDVKKIIKVKINPAESKLGVCDLKNKLLVKWSSENDRERLLTESQEKSPKLKASLPKRRNPAIIVKNVPNEVNNEDLLKVISEQNPEIVVDDESIRQCKVRFALKTFQYTRHVIETHPTVRKSILRQTRLKIIWSVCDVDDFLIINRCFNSLGYNHRADE